ncbi:MAG: outer membrane protein assembly factor BamE [Betaproteobacteria bacterium]|nr:outer membrane protein assembly factor BamE [Betaproteobacteria bacterium]
MLVAVALLPACSGFGVYRLDIQQGNLITQEQLSKVKPGMARIDIRNLLGTPLLQDVFYGNRWDYYFSDERGKYGPFGREKQTYKITIVFENEKVAKVEGVASPTEIFLGGGEKRRLPDTQLPNAPTPPKS